MGPKHSARAGARLAAPAGCVETTSGSAAVSAEPLVVVAGFCGGLRPEIRLGDVVVASELHGPAGVRMLPQMSSLVDALRAAGLAVHVGPIIGSEHVALGDRRALYASDRALGVDMESYWLLESCTGPAAVIRAVSDTAGAGFLGGMLPDGWLRAYRSLVRVGGVLEEWAGRVQ
jgi:4-hydroxy-3-methylbut-2-en-1-yl diphosphate reductase